MKKITFAPMNVFHRIFSFVLSLLLFAGSVGLDVYIHECATDGKTISLFFQPEDPCDEHLVETPSSCETTCCSSQEGIAPQKCCTENVEHFQINSEFASFGNADNLYIPLVENPKIESENYRFIAVKSTPINLCPNPPPNKKGRDILIKNQVFII